jgi:hypothetical protein
VDIIRNDCGLSIGISVVISCWLTIYLLGYYLVIYGHTLEVMAEV